MMQMPMGQYRPEIHFFIGQTRKESCWGCAW